LALRSSAVAIALVGAGVACAPAALAASCTDSWVSPIGGSWTTAGNWSSNAVPTASDDVCIEVSGTYTVTLPASASVHSLTLGSASGTGTQTLDVTSATGQSPTLSLAADSAIGATGQLEIDSPATEPAVTISAPSTATLIDDGDLLVGEVGGSADYLRANLTIDASGSAEIAGPMIQDQGTTTTNDGSFNVDASSAFTVTNGNAVFVNGGSVVDDGLIKLTGNASWTQNAPAAAAQSGNPVEIFGSGTLNDQSGTGSFDLVDSAILDGTIPAGQTVTAEAFSGHNATIQLGATVINDGTLVLDQPNSPANYADLIPNSSTLVNNGTVTAQSESTSTTPNYLEADLTNNASGTLQVTSGTLKIDEGTTLTNAGTLTVASDAALDATNGNALIINNAAGQNTITNSGTIQLTGNASFTQNGNQAGNPVQIFGAGTLDDETGPGSFDLVDTAKLEGTIAAGQTVTAEAIPGHNALIDLTNPPVTNNGAIVLDEPAGSTNYSGITPNTATLINNGTITTQTEETGTTPNYLEANLTNTTTGTLTIASGTLQIDEGTTLTNDGALTVASGATLSATNGSAPIVNHATGQNTFDDAGSVVLSGNASFTQNGNETGHAVEVSNTGTFDDESGPGSFELVDTPILEGTIPSGQTVTMAALSGHQALAQVSNTVTNHGTVVLDAQAGGNQAGLTQGSGAAPVFENFGQVTTQSESANPDEIRVAFVNEGSGSVEVASGTLLGDEGYTITNDGTFTTDAQSDQSPVPTLSLTNGSAVFVNGGSVVDDGLIKLTGNASWTQNAPAAAAQSGNPVEIFGSGTLNDQSGTGSFDLVDSAILDGTIPAGQTVTAEAFSGHNATIQLGATVINDGTLVLDQPNSPANYADLIPNSSTLVNNGTVTAQSESTSTTPNYLEADLTNNASGTLQVTSGTLKIDEGTTLTNAGTLTVASDAALDATNGNALIINNAAGQNTITNSGTIQLTGNASFTQNGNQAGNPVQIFGAGTLDDETGPGSFDLVDTAKLEGTIAAGQTVTAEAIPGHNALIDLTNPPVTNNGAIVLDEPAGSTNYSGITPNTATLINNGTITTQTEETGTTPNYLEANLTNTTTGTLTIASGTLQIDEGTSLLNHGVIEVSADAKLNATNGNASIVNESDGTIEPDIAGQATFGTINLSGNAELALNPPAGTLAPNLVGGYSPAPGTLFDVITGSNGGTFAAVTNDFTGVYTTAHVIAVERSPDATTTTLAAMPTSSTFGEEVTLTATITPDPGGFGTPTGQVTFMDGSTSLGTASVATTAGVSTATIQTTTAAPLPVGPNELTATYSGDADFLGSSTSSATPEDVAQATPTVTIEASSPTSPFGSPVSFTATVTGPAGVTPPTGTVTFTVGTTALGTAAVSTTSGVTTAMLMTGALPVGSDQVNASYGGDANYAQAAAAAPADVSVGQIATGTGLTASPNPVPNGTQVTLTATVTPASGSGPTGTVTFTADSGADTLGTASVSTTAGVSTAQLQVTLTTGTYDVVAAYGGDQTFAASSSSPALPVTVNPPPPSITQQPLNQAVTAPAAASFTAAASGATGVQWQVSTNAGASWTNDTSDAGNTTDTLTISPTSTAQSGNEYRAVFANAGGSTPTNAATLTVAASCTAAPRITTNPRSTSVTQPAAATFTSAASDPAGCSTLTVQWQVSTNGGSNWSNDTGDAGNTTDTLTISPTSTAQSGNEYRAVFSDESGSTASNAAKLTVAAPPCTVKPTITSSPQNASVLAPAPATFTAAASNPASCTTLTVQWQESVRSFYGTVYPFTNISGATSATLAVNPTALINSGDRFRVLFTNRAGTTTSPAATLYADAQPQVPLIYPTRGAANVCCVAIEGANFNPIETTAVLFGTLPARFEVFAPNLIAAWAPPGPLPGATVGVTVVNGPLTSVLGIGDLFTYTATGGPLLGGLRGTAFGQLRLTPAQRRQLEQFVRATRAQMRRARRTSARR
jgi:hypothetical protein